MPTNGKVYSLKLHEKREEVMKFADNLLKDMKLSDNPNEVIEQLKSAYKQAVLKVIIENEEASKNESLESGLFRQWSNPY